MILFLNQKDQRRELYQGIVKIQVAEIILPSLGLGFDLYLLRGGLYR